MRVQCKSTSIYWVKAIRNLPECAFSFGEHDLVDRVNFCHIGAVLKPEYSLKHNINLHSFIQDPEDCIC
jgi:hypothetical protein